MPYIKQENRFYKDSTLYDSYETSPKNAGELNYILTLIIKEYFNNSNSQNYQAINDIIGALEGTKLEFYRRIAIPYEEKNVMRMEMYINGIN